jgi:glycosidase
MNHYNYPSLYQINTRVWLTDLSKGLGRQATLDDIPDFELDRLASLGFSFVWFLSVWATGEGSRKISRENPEWRQEFELTLTDLIEDDIGGSGFAIAGYHVLPSLGGDEALKRLRTRLSARGMKLMLDFVPNHMGPDHPWVHEYPEYFISGTEDDLKNSPQNYTRIKLKQGEKIFAYGRDPYFAGWPDTIQLDYSNPATAAAICEELERISTQCDGVRCDMAMLILPEIFERTWGRKAQVFWPTVITAIHEKSPAFCFLAEVYWDMEWALQQQGFNYTYDKRLYDRLREGHTKSIREHFQANPEYQNKMARFLENHDEPRVASTFNIEQHKAAAVITFFSPGLRFFHQGQFEGRKKRISPHLIRAPYEPVNENLSSFYNELLAALKQPVFYSGRWHLLDCLRAWDGNESRDAFIAFSWEEKDNRALVVVNYAPHHSQCYLKLPFSGMNRQAIQFRDLVGDAFYIRDGNDISVRGLYLDLQPWGFHVFEVT